MNGPADELRRVFLEACALDEAARSEYLDRVCAGDPALRREVESLLIEDARSQSPIPHDPTGTLEPSPRSADAIPLEAGATIGPYRLVRVLGSGGMGSVYEAVQPNPERRIALKLLRDGAFSEEAQRRFRREAEILAHLDHPGIARVFESGVDTRDGVQRHYIAMELVPDARDLITYADEEGLPPSARLELFEKVCDAVHHGHTRGFIHRDLKPDNLLVGPDGQPKVIDFGVARALDPTWTTLHTHTHGWIGTLQTMSPEQCSGDSREIDTRSDVYALGVVLYLLMVGTPPYDIRGASLIEAARIVCRQPPRRPRQVRPDLRSDVEAVILKALEKAPRDRYQSAQELQDDVHRAIQGRTVTARPPGTLRRLLEVVVQHPVLAVGLLGLVVGVLTTLSTTLFLNFYVARQPDRIVINSQQHHVQLLSRTGEVLHTWPSRSARGAWILPRPPAFGGGRLALVHFASGDLEPDARGVIAYDVEHPARAVWRVEDTPLELPLRLPAGVPRQREHAFFDPEIVAIHDFFPASPGDELLVITRWRPHSQLAIRIFDLSGRLRYEVWHDGTLDSQKWRPEEGLWIAAGHNSECRWDERGIQLDDQIDPAVVIGLRPALDHVQARFIALDGEIQDETVAWYRWIGPVKHLDRLRGHRLNFQYDLVSPQYRGTAASLLDLELWLDVPEASRPTLQWVLDGEGRIDTVIPHDRYRIEEAEGRLPPPSELGLFDYAQLPPRTPPP